MRAVLDIGDVVVVGVGVDGLEDLALAFADLIFAKDVRLRIRSAMVQLASMRLWLRAYESTT